MQKIILLGAGSASLSCAYGLKDEKFNLEIFERNSYLGGMAATLVFKEGDLFFKSDIGPHRFFTPDFEVNSLVKGLLGKEALNVQRKTRQYIGGKFYDYPINIWQALRNVGISKASRFLTDYLRDSLSYWSRRKKILTMHDHLLANFGRSLSDFCMTNYTIKVWGRHPKDMGAEMAQQRIKGLDLKKVIRGYILGDKNKTKTLAQNFLYPLEGTGSIYDKMSQSIKRNTKINLNSEVAGIYLKNNKVHSINVKIKEKIKKINCDKIVSSIPLDNLIKMMKPSPPPEVINAAKSLKWRGQIYLFVTLNRERVFRDQWIYFPETSIPFGRISEMKNFSKELCPSDKTLIVIEFFASESDAYWQLSKEQLFEMAYPLLNKVFSISRGDVRNIYLKKSAKVYPIYELNYLSKIEIIFNFLKKIKNLYVIGRPGLFLHNNQDNSIKDGLRIAARIANSKEWEPEREIFGNRYIEENIVAD